MTAVEDAVYGEQRVEEDVLQELIRSRPVQRLKGVKQNGPQPHFIEKPVVTRYDHSVGVMLLLRRFDAPVEEQIAGLLHDVPHTAYSHVADFVFPNEEHSFHERFLEDVVMGSDIPRILERHGFDTRYILDEDNFPMLEQDLPGLCADRIDYFLRDLRVVGGEAVTGLLDGLSTAEGVGRGDRFVVPDPGTAEQVALRYIAADEAWWANPEEVAIMRVFADAVRAALDAGMMTRDDLFRDDDHVWELLHAADVTAVQKPLQRLREQDIVVGVDEPDIVVETKARAVDPLTQYGDRFVPVSTVSERVADRVEKHTAWVRDGFRVAFR